MSIDAMKQALEALENGGRIETNEAITALRLAIEQAEKQAALDRMADNARELGLDYEPVAWKNAAMRIGEELSSVGPDGYYNMTAEQWLHWAMDQQPRGKNSLTAPPQRQPLPSHEIVTVYEECPTSDSDMIAFARAIEAAHGIGGEA